MTASQWKKGMPEKSIPQKRVDIWRGPLSLSEKQRMEFLETLSREEKEKAFRFHFEKDSTAFIAARGMLRHLLSHYLGEKPESLQFGYNSFGKPFLMSPSHGEPLHFNLSHAGNLGLFAFSSEQELGIDVELIREDFSIDSIVEHYFCPPEIKAIQNSDPSAAFSLFFKFWTRKEAINKAMGKGLSFPLEKCNVSHIQGFDFSPVSLPDAEEKDPVWYVRDLSPEGNYAAALSLQYPEIEISFWDFPL
ncbi:4'-phosphopantetheinyl transferase family protein [Cecembia calidifontis]|uniref:4'-phosphopantetheinyl transferase n=1 Tax=Cecembia calidifontis TaxID=1187080 RepID=A0A4Q7P7P6_9BACT|nr:4'-phosphopantetheinyl transferase superfamily protein [Cecembia calidifontis]RZS95510.1 4'-phosphopantetheinyl transferase [Cecembia calidifontis]